jgi:hypothetical protein
VVNRLPVPALLAMSLAAAAAWGLSRVLLLAPCWSILLPVACLAWPIWFGQREYGLFQRRLALGAATRPDSPVRRWFWRGRVASFFLFVSALAWSGLLLLMIPLLGPWHLALLAIDVLVLASAIHVAGRLLARDVRPEHLGLLSRRWVLGACNIALLAVGFFAIDYFVGAPDTRGMNFGSVADQAFRQFEQVATCPVVASALGLLNMVDRLGWHLAQGSVPALPGSGHRLLAWAALLLQAGIVGIAFTRLQMGVLALVARARAGAAEASRDGLFPKSLPVIVLGFVLVLPGLQALDPASMRPVALVLGEALDPCRPVRNEMTGLQTRLTGEVEARRVTRRADLEGEVTRSVGAVFAQAEAGVDRYLDWYFSLAGQYQRLGALVAGRSIEAMNTRIDSQLESVVFTAPRIAQQLAEADTRIGQQTRAAVQQMAAEVGRQIALPDSTPCIQSLFDPAVLDQVQRDVRALGISAAAGVAGAAAVRVAASGVSRAVIARLAARPAYRGAGSVLARLLGKRAGWPAGVAVRPCGRRRRVDHRRQGADRDRRASLPAGHAR